MFLAQDIFCLVLVLLNNKVSLLSLYGTMFHTTYYIILIVMCRRADNVLGRVSITRV